MIYFLNFKLHNLYKTVFNIALLIVLLQKINC